MKTSLVTGTMIAAMAAASVAQAHGRAVDQSVRVDPSGVVRSFTPSSVDLAGTMPVFDRGKLAHRNLPMKVADQQWVK